MHRHWRERQFEDQPSDDNNGFIILSKPLGRSDDSDTDRYAVTPPFPISTRQAAYPQPHPIVIAVMGASGTGKSTFINLASGPQSCVAPGTRSRTATIGNSGIFELNGQRVILLDCPGFNDTTKTDTETLKLISAYLSSAYKMGVKLSGVLYLHRISDNRVGGTSLKNMRMFRKLCGEETLRNVVIVTTMWGLIDAEAADKREQELLTDSLFFKEFIDQGAGTSRHDNMQQSAHAILRRVIRNTTVPLRIQREIVDEHKSVVETAAGVEISRELEALTEKLSKYMWQELSEEMMDTEAIRDRKYRQELVEGRSKLVTRAQEAQQAIDSLHNPLPPEVEEEFYLFWGVLITNSKRLIDTSGLVDLDVASAWSSAISRILETVNPFFLFTNLRR